MRDNLDPKVSVDCCVDYKAEAKDRCSLQRATQILSLQRRHLTLRLQERVGDLLHPVQARHHHDRGAACHDQTKISGLISNLQRILRVSQVLLALIQHQVKELIETLECAGHCGCEERRVFASVEGTGGEGNETARTKWARF